MKKYILIVLCVMMSSVSFAKEYTDNDCSFGIEFGTNVINTNKFKSCFGGNVYGNYHKVDFVIGCSGTKRYGDNENYAHYENLSDFEFHLGVGRAIKFKTTRLSVGAMIGGYFTDKGNKHCRYGNHIDNDHYCPVLVKETDGQLEFGVYCRCTQQITKTFGVNISCQYLYNDNQICTYQKDQLQVMGGINITF